MIISMEYKNKREYECGSFKRNSSVAPFSLFIFFFLLFCIFWWPQWLFIFNSHLSYLRSFKFVLFGIFSSLSGNTLFYKKYRRSFTLYKTTQHKEETIMMYANVFLCQCSTIYNDSSVSCSND